MPPRRYLQPRPTPAIPSGTWRAAGFQFRKPVRIPVALPVEAFTRIRRIQIGNNGIDSGTISAGGTATVSVGPQGYGTRWYPNQVGIQTLSGAADASTATGYLNVVGPGGFLFQSYAGGGDQPGVALPEMQPGDLLYVVWSGGKPGDWCQLTVTGPMDVLVPLRDTSTFAYTDNMVAYQEELEAKRLAYLALAEHARQPSRDELIRQAAAAGIRKGEIAAILRLHRSTVYAILKAGRDAEA